MGWRRCSGPIRGRTDAKCEHWVSLVEPDRAAGSEIFSVLAQSGSNRARRSQEVT